MITESKTKTLTTKNKKEKSVCLTCLWISDSASIIFICKVICKEALWYKHTVTFLLLPLLINDNRCGQLDLLLTITGFYMIAASVMKKLISWISWKTWRLSSITLLTLENWDKPKPYAHCTKNEVFHLWKTSFF